MGLDAVIRFFPGRKLDIESESWRLVEAVGREPFWLDSEDKTRTAIMPLTRYTDDDKEEPVAGGYEVSLCERYYGPSYERGLWTMLAAILIWLRLNYPDGRVEYGGDNDGTLDTVDDDFMSAMWSHWAKFGGQPYRRGFSNPDSPKNVATCCGGRVYVNRWCGGRVGGYCPVCDARGWIENGVLTPDPSPTTT